MLSSYHYYTGVIFAGYTYGSGEPIVKGGRYDKLLTYFGKDAASIGFAIVVDQLMAAISRQKIEITVKHDNQLIVYKPEYRREAVKKAIALSAKDCNVELIAWAMDKSKADYEAYALRNQIAELTFMDGE